MLPNIEQSVLVLVSDPWDFADEVANNPFLAVVVTVSQDAEDGIGALLLRVSSPFAYKGERCVYFVANRRHEEPNGRTRDWSECGYNLTHIPVSRALGPTPFDLSWWRGGIGLLATISGEPTA